MRIFILRFVVVFHLLGCSFAYSETYESEHFVIHSVVDYRFVEFIQNNIEPFYDEMVSGYFGSGWEKPLNIYYSKTQSDTQELFDKLGYKDKAHYGVYIPSMNAIFTHRNMDSGNFSGLGTLYHEIIHCFVGVNFDRAPTWFNEGLATLLGEQVRYVNGRLTIGCANPWREQILREMIEKGEKIDVKKLASMSTATFYGRYDNYHLTRALFYWVYEGGYLQEYLQNVQKEGYGIAVLEKTVGKTCESINLEVLEFIKSNCYPAAYYQDGIETRSLREKKAFFEKSLEIKPNYCPSKLELARCYFDENDYENCEAMLDSILVDPGLKEYSSATRLLGRIYYKQKKFADALELYEKAWESCSYYEYRYEDALYVANCYHLLGDRAKAKQWYTKFVDDNWEPDRMAGQVKFARNYEAAPVK